MKARYLIDSVILIDHLNGVPAATRWLAALQEGEAVISVITRAEILAGGTPSERDAAALLCDQFECLPLTPIAADRAAELRREHRWRLPDAFQAALADLHRLRLVTRNERDFPPGKLAFVLRPYRLGPAGVP